MKNESKKFTMKVLYSFITIVFTALVYLVAIGNAEKKSPFKMTSKTSGLKIEKRLIRVAYKAATPDEEQIADILWIQKAAKMTKKIGFPYFKIKHRVVKKHFEKKYAQDLTLIEGVIEATDDFVSTTFDVELIETLSLRK
jgi:hypothetical protein